MTHLTFLEAVEQFLDKHVITDIRQRREMTSDLIKIASHFADARENEVTLCV
jgi:hypothetical protein